MFTKEKVASDLNLVVDEGKGVLMRKERAD